MASSLPSPLVLNNLSKNQITLFPYEPSLNNPDNSGEVQHHPLPRPTQYIETHQPVAISRLIHGPLKVKIKTYTVWSVLNILLCCTCIGSCACYYSMETKQLRNRGDIRGAVESSKTARQLNIISTGAGIFILLIVVPVLVIQRDKFKQSL